MSDVGKLKLIEVGALFGSPWNRAADGNGELKELIESIKEVGILQPLVVRELETGWEIVAGHRRWYAAKAAGFSEVSCIVVEMDDQEAKVAQITENLHRKNLNPMEEARAFLSLLENNAHTAQTIADLVGKDVKYVYRSLELLKLPEKARTAIEKGTISAAHGHQLARVGPKQIETIIAYATTAGWMGEIPSVQALKDEIGRRVEKKLSTAPFEKNKEFAGKIACKGCPSNSANQDVLFDDAEDGFCTNNLCFASKLHQFYKDLQREGEAKWPNLKFIGTASSSYGNTQVIKGYAVVEAADPKVKKAITLPKLSDTAVKKHQQVEGYGFGILKPSSWGKIKVAKLVVLKKMAEGAQQTYGYKNQQDPDAKYYWKFVQAFVSAKIKKDCEVLERAQAAYDKKGQQLQAEAQAIWKKGKKEIIAEYKKKEDAGKKAPAAV